MTLREFALPDLGEGLTEADILNWLVAEGESVRLNQPIVEVETAKAAVEVPSPWTGVVRRLLVSPGDTVPVGTRIIAIETDVPAGEATEATPAAVAATHAQTQGAMLVGYGPRPSTGRRRRRIAPEPVAEPAAVTPSDADVTVLAKPPIRKLARDLGIDLRTIRGTGPAGSITRADLGAVSAAATGHPSVSGPNGHGAQPSPDRRIPLHGIAKAMSEAMTRSAFTAPHASVVHTVDATETMALRRAFAARPEFAETPVTPLAVIARAVCVALREFPLLNAALDAATQEIVLHDEVNLGIAVATPRGLIVPNLKNAGALSLRDLAAALAELATTAREGHTRPADLTGGTITITNVGVFGIEGGTPILNPGESAILAIGAIAPRPWVHDGELAVREVVQLSLSFDHRIIDGATAGRFLAAVGAMVADPRLLLALA